ncbi:MAG: pyridoxal-phosphate dependent enzyme, partial [Candidatus Diapherotrites archaeon]
NIHLSASILPLKNLSKEKIAKNCILALQGGASSIHIDYAPELSKGKGILEKGSEITESFFTPKLVRFIKKFGNKKGIKVEINVHLMCHRPSVDFLVEWASSGADAILVHWEAFKDKNELINALKEVNKTSNVGISIRPDVNFNSFYKFVKVHGSMLKIVSVCGTYPCLGGQQLAYHILDYVKKLKELRSEKNFNYKITVDGGLKAGATLVAIIGSGADVVTAGSAIFGDGKQDLTKISEAISNLMTFQKLSDSHICATIAEKIKSMRNNKKGKLWIAVEGYHGGGKTYFTKILQEYLIAVGLEPVLLPLDISWTDRSFRAKLKEEAYNARKFGKDHFYFNSLSQKPVPAHWRKKHSDKVIIALEKRLGKVVIEDCYQFNERGDTNGKLVLHLTHNSVVIVEGVYVSATKKKKWDLKIYLETDKELAKQAAMIRDEKKVFRPREETKMLYEDVYERSYDEYQKKYKPTESADILIENNPKDISKGLYIQRILDSKYPIFLLECTNKNCRAHYSSCRIPSCPLCGNDLQSTIVGNVNFLKSINKKIKSMWRYKALLPIKDENIVSDGEGNTPLIYLEKASKALGVHIWAKLETVNPTGTFKDREGSYVISLSKQYRQQNVVMQSTGNTAISVTYYAGLAGIKSWCFIPSISTYKLLMPSKKLENKIIAVKGHPIDVKEVAEKFAAEFDFPKISPFYERCEANATIGYEIGEAILKKKVPKIRYLNGGNFDFYVQTISAGMGAIGFYYAMERLNKWTKGRIKIPKILAVEISEFAPIHYAIERDLEQVGDEVATPHFPDKPLFEPTLWTTNIKKYYPYLRKIIKGSQGFLVIVKPEEVLEIVDKYGIRNELLEKGFVLSDTEKATFIGFAGLVKKILSGDVPKGSSVLIMITGKGMKSSFALFKPDFEVDPKLHTSRDIFNALELTRCKT